jgi:flagellar biosynthesis/type III secretory pathway protein FliH
MVAYLLTQYKALSANPLTIKEGKNKRKEEGKKEGREEGRKENKFQNCRVESQCTYCRH